MRKDTFADASRAQAGEASPKIEGTSEIQEIKVSGDWAFMWTALSVVATPRDGSPVMTRAGHTLSILKREEGKWVLARDANMLAPVQSPALP
jgi:ketosteroid isomerase-like protein